MDLAVQYRLPKRLGLISLGVKNLFDEQFNFQDTDPFNPDVIPDPAVFSLGELEEKEIGTKKVHLVCVNQSQGRSVKAF